jgi:hypothetical protein
MMKILFVIMLIAVSAIAGQAQTKVAVGNIISAERIVKNAPFSADAINESMQMLPDGNRIVRRSTSHLYRDSEGRYRREDLPKQLGLDSTVIDMPESTSIIDPVAGFRYTLNPKTKTVRQSPFRSVFEYKLKSELYEKMKTDLYKEKEKAIEKEAKAKAVQDAQNSTDADTGEKAAERAKRAEARRDEMETRAAERAKQAEARKTQMAERKAELEKKIRANGDLAATISAATAAGTYAPYVPYSQMSSKYETKTESLGVQNIEGVQAEGTRSTTTIPAGAIGNERAIDVVYEKWYSKDLQMTILSKHNDPRSGEQTYRLTNIRRDEPPASLFTPPADYKLIESGAPKPRAVVVPKPATVIKVAPLSATAPAAPKKANEQQ